MPYVSNGMHGYITTTNTATSSNTYTTVITSITDAAATTTIATTMPITEIPRRIFCLYVQVKPAIYVYFILRRDRANIVAVETTI